MRDYLWEYLREDPRSQASQCKDSKSKEMQGSWCDWSREKKRQGQTDNTDHCKVLDSSLKGDDDPLQDSEQTSDTISLGF